MRMCGMELSDMPDSLLYVLLKCYDILRSESRVTSTFPEATNLQWYISISDMSE